MGVAPGVAESLLCPKCQWLGALWMWIPSKNWGFFGECFTH